jgi:type IV pilus assembly protein PilB
LCATERVTVFEPVGCTQCHKGFSGRTGIFQVMPMSAEMQALVLQEAGIQKIERQARREGVSSLRIAGLRKVLQGITSLDEVLIATREDT